MEEVRTVTGSLDRDLRREGHAGGVGGWGGGGVGGSFDTAGQCNC